MEEILHQLILVCSLSHYLQAFIHPRWLFGISSISIYVGETVSDCFEKKTPNRFGLQAQHFDNDRAVGTLRRAEGFPCDLRE